MDRAYAALGRFVVRFRYLIVMAWVAITILSVVALPSLDSAVQSTANSSFLPASAPSMQAAALAAPFQNTQYASATIVAVRDQGPLTSTDQAAITRLESLVRAMPQVKTVSDLSISPDGAASQNAIQYLVFLLIIVLLFATFRALLAPLLTLIPAVLVLFLSDPVIAFAVTRLGVQASSITQVILIVIILGAGTDYGVFLTFRVREELRRGLDPKEAVFWPTSTSKREQVVSAGLWGRLTGRLIQRPAVTLCVGVILFVGLALGQVGTSLGGFSAQSSGPAGADSTVGTAVIAAHYPNTNQNPAEILLRFPHSVWNAPQRLATAEQGLMQIPALRTVLGPLNPNGVPLTVAELTHLHTQLGPPQALPATPPSTSSVSLQTYNAYRATGQYLSADGQTVQFVAIPKDRSSSLAAINTIPALRAAVAQAARASGASLNGVVSTNAFNYDAAQTSQSDLMRILPIVAALIALLLALVLRSVVAPLYLLASVVLSYLAAWWAVAIVFVHLIGDDGVSYFLPFILFVFLVALGSDYNILVMRRIREEAQRQPLREAVREAITRTGGTVTAAGIILAGTFAVLSLEGTNDASRSLGFGLAAGILLDTFLIRTLLIPALVVLLGRWNWWPSRLFRRTSPSETLKANAEQTISQTGP